MIKFILDIFKPEEVKAQCPNSAICAYEYKGSLFKTIKELDEHKRNLRLRKLRETIRSRVMDRYNMYSAEGSHIERTKRTVINEILSDHYLPKIAGLLAEYNEVLNTQK